MKFKTALIYYYGILQTLHLLGLLVNLVMILQADLSFTASLSSNLDSSEILALQTSSYMDMFVSAPFGIAFAIATIKQKSSATLFGTISLTAAVISAFVYTYLLILFEAFDATFLNVLFIIIFAPVFLLIAINTKEFLVRK